MSFRRDRADDVAAMSASISAAATQQIPATSHRQLAMGKALSTRDVSPDLYRWIVGHIRVSSIQEATTSTSSLVPVLGFDCKYKYKYLSSSKYSSSSARTRT